MTGSTRGLLAAALTVAVACAPGLSGGAAAGTGPATGVARTTAKTRAETARQEARTHWAKRLDEAELRLALAAWERATAADTGDVGSWLMLARGRFFLADGFLNFRKLAGDQAAAAEYTATHLAGASAAERGLRAASREFHRLRAQSAPFADAIAVLSVSEMPLLYWWAENTILWANSKGLAATIRSHETVFHAMERVADLAPETFFGGPDRYFGIVFCAAPAIAGGDLSKGRTHFEQSLKRAPEFLDTYVLFALLYAKPAHDDALYAQLLQHVVDAPVDVLPDMVPEQTIAKKKAAALLAKAPAPR